MNEKMLANAFVQALNQHDAQKATGYKHDPTTIGGVGPYAHGAGGLFSTPGQDLNIFSAMIMPKTSLLDSLPVMPAGFANMGQPDFYGGQDSPLHTIITGVTLGNAEALANQRETPCGDAPEGGLLKVCTITRPFGRYSIKVHQLDVRERNRLTTYAEPTGVRPVANAGVVLFFPLPRSQALPQN